jgi:hypothetical protein
VSGDATSCWCCYSGDAGNANSDDDDPAMPLQRLTMMQVLVLRGC